MTTQTTSSLTATTPPVHRCVEWINRLSDRLEIELAADRAGWSVTAAVSIDQLHREINRLSECDLRSNWCRARLLPPIVPTHSGRGMGGVA